MENQDPRLLAKKLESPTSLTEFAPLLTEAKPQTSSFSFRRFFWKSKGKILFYFLFVSSVHINPLIDNRFIGDFPFCFLPHQWLTSSCHIHVKCNSTCVRSVVMKSNREFENRAAIIVALRAGRSPKEIVDFLKLPKTTIYRVKKQFDEADSNKEGIATRKKHSRRSDRVRGEEFVKNVKEKIDGNPGKSMRAIAKEMDVGSMTIVRTIHEDLGLKSYALRKGQLLTENMKNNRKGKAAALLNNLKHDSFGMLRFFSDEKNFDVDQKVNPRNDRWICKDPSEIPVVMHTKFPASVMVLGVISSEGDASPFL
ncbi:IKK1 [Cordylochernes scorpioides]|uniref:IKK1 n=1 Tax=Cordylochernes scorpioides TaxID=51811 RepID=A0ABY6KWD4_9ARAC|nr:IKK1 [Cordylochernes scorpioides]